MSPKLAARRALATFTFVVGVVHAAPARATEEASDEASAASAPASDKPKNCGVGWATLGGLGGAALGFYGAMGITEAAGVNFFDSPTAFWGAVAAEGVGAIAGPIATCRFSKDPRIVPAASFVIAGGIAGGAAAGGGFYLLLSDTHVDWPVGLAFLGAIVAGAAGGGYLGWLVHEAREPASQWSASGRAPRAARTPWTFAPVVANGTGGVALAGSF